MFEELYEKLPDRALYWKRLGIEPPAGPLDRKTLDAITFAHQCAIPFENLDACEWHRAPSLGIVDLFDKIIVGSRGGYCFELNALFTALLMEAGFQAVSVFARSLANRGYRYPVQHRGVVVTVDGQKLYCDVGYGGPMPACSLPLVDGAEATSCGQTFRIERDEGPWWRILYLGHRTKGQAARADQTQDFAEGERASGMQAQRGEARSSVSRPVAAPVPVLAFLDAPQDPVDFVPLSYFSATSPQSVFTQRRMVNRRTPDGSVSINADTFTRTTFAGKETFPIASEEEFRLLLAKEFDIRLGR